MTYQVSQEVLRIAIMGERYGSGDMQKVCRAVRELHAIQSSQVPPPVEEAQPGSPTSHSAPAAAEFWPCVPVEYFEANDDQSPMGVI